METGAHRSIGVAEPSQLRTREAGVERAANETRAEEARPRDESATQLQLSESARAQAQQPVEAGSQTAAAGLNPSALVSAANEIENAAPDNASQQANPVDVSAGRGAAQIEIGSEARRLARQATDEQADVGNNRGELAASPEREAAEQRIDMPAGGAASLDAGVSEDKLGVVTDAGLNA